MQSLCGKTVAILGMGVSNRPLLDFLLGEGAKVTVRDQKEQAAFARWNQPYLAAGVRFLCGGDYLANLTEAVLFRSPGIRFDTPEIAAAVANGSVLTSEMELFFARTPATVIGVTGSDGKTTTTTLIYRMLAEAGYTVYLGGNIGNSLLPALSEMREGDFAVVELSSFQLHTMRQSPQIAVFTNLSPNHLDYHTDFAEYVAAKTNIFQHPNCRKLVLNFACPHTRALVAQVPDTVSVVGFCADGTVRLQDGCLRVDKTPLFAAADIRLPGQHNLENYLAAVGAVADLVSPAQMRRVATTFTGVAHRLQTVAVRDGITYINSSIDSTPSRTVAALSALKDHAGRLVLLLGGYDKHLPFDVLAAPVCATAKAVVLTGATAPAISAALTASAAYANHPIPLLYAPMFDHAVRVAQSLCQAGDILLLSPACASFDAFPNFAARGTRFAELVDQIPERKELL